MSGTWASGWVTGDIVTATEFAKGVGCVADTTLGASAASIDFTGLPTTYAHLMIVAYLRGDTAAAATIQQIRFNNDTSSIYYTQSVDVNATTVAGSETLASTSILCGSAPAASATANRFSALRIDVPNYGNASNHKSVTGTNHSPRSTTTGTIFETAFSGVWAATAAINRITLLPAAGNFVAGSRVSIYVMGS